MTRPKKPGNRQFEAAIAAIAALPRNARPEAKDAARRATLQHRQSASERAVFECILQATDWRTGVARDFRNASERPSTDLRLKAIAALTGLSARQVRRACDRLEAIGLIAVERDHHEDGSNKASRYVASALLTSMSPPADNFVTRGDDGQVMRGDDNGVTPNKEASEYASDTPVVSNETPKPRSNRTAAYTQAFEQFWQAYPRNVAKHAAAIAFAKLIPAEQAHATAAAARFAREVTKAGTDKQYVPHPATFLNSRRFEDYPPALSDPGDGSSPEVLPREAQLRIARRFVQSNWWDRELGPPPGSPGCPIDDGVLAEVRASHGRNPGSRSEAIDAGAARHLN